MKKFLIAALASVLVLGAAGCGGPAPEAKESRAPEISIEQPWVRTTEESKSPTATGMFMSINNPGTTDVSLVSADYADAGKCEIHEMVKGPDGKMMMQPIKDGLVIKAGGHQHLKPGDNHVMLMMLKKPLKVGDEVKVTLKFSNGLAKEVTAPVKKFTEEQEHYHPSASATPTK